MTRDLATRSSAGKLAIAATMCASAAALTIVAAAATIVVAAAAAVVVTGTGDDVRRSLRLSFAGVSHTHSEVLSIALQNTRIAGAAFFSAVAVPRLPSRVRMLVDALLATVSS